MVRGIHLTLLIGPGVPAPAPKPVIDALLDVRVNGGGTRSGFQLTFAVGKVSPLLALLAAGFFDPAIRVIVVVTVAGFPHVLMDGLITRQELNPSDDPGQSTLTVTGEDLSVAMDGVRIKDVRYPALPDQARVATILARYAFLGLVPVVMPTFLPNVENPIDRIDSHQGTDLEYIRSLASDNGYVFFVEPGPAPGTSVAYWGPEVRVGAPQPALSVNMDQHTNVMSLSFSLDGLAKTLFIVYVLDPFTRKIVVPVPVPDVGILRPPLGARPTPPLRVEFIEDAAKLDPIKAALLGVSAAAGASDAVSGSGELDVLRYGHVLRARHLVAVRGAGLAYDGLYYVTGVTSRLRRGEFRQNFTLVRDNLISTLPVVLP